MPKRPKFRDKSVRPARGDLADRHPLSCKLNSQRSFDSAPSSTSVLILAGGCRSIAGGQRPELASRSAAARFWCSSRELADRSYLPRCGKRGDCLQIGEKNNESPLERYPSHSRFIPQASVCEGNVTWVLEYWPQTVSCVCGHRWGRSLRPVRVRFVQSGDLGIYQ